PMATPETRHESVLEAGSIQARVAKMYAEALLAAAMKQSDADAVDTLGDELDAFVHDVLDANPEVEKFLASPIVGRKAKTAVLEAALPGRVSDLLRGLFGVLNRNGRLDLIRGIAVTYRQLLEVRAGRVRVKVTAAAPLSHAQETALTETLSGMMTQQPVLD